MDLGFLVILMAGWLASGAADGLVVYRVVPHDTDPAITRFDDPHYIVFDPARPASADLLLFMSGTGGRPENLSEFIKVAAEQGYRAVSLAYNNVPAVVAVCPQDPDPGCSAKFRSRRIFGTKDMGGIDDEPAESIVNRFTKLLVSLDRLHPTEGWGAYLDGGKPRWERIAVAGHSQGAGMAAFIAQKVRVARVILFSSPWDFFGKDRRLAPWVLDGPGATPAESWFGAFHEKENTADLLGRAYKALKVPAAHVRVLTLEPARMGGPNPYHVSVVGNMATPRDRKSVV